MRAVFANILILALVAVAGWMTAFIIANKTIPVRRGGSPPVSLLTSGVQDAGTVCPGDPITTSFVLNNTRNVPVRLRSVETGCNCTEYEIDGTEIDPGGIRTLWLTTTVDENVIRQSSIEAKANVFFEGYSEPLRLSVRATVVPELPAVLDFGRVLQNEERLVKRFSVHCCAESLLVTDVASDSPWLDAQLVESPDGSGNDSIIEATVFQPQIAGDIVGRLTVNFADPQAASQTVAVRATIAPRIEARPPCLILGTFSRGTIKRRSFRLVSTIGEPFTVCQPTSDLSELRCQLSPASTIHSEFVGQVVFGASAEAGTVVGSVEIITSDAQCPRVVIPVYGACVASNDDPHR